MKYLITGATGFLATPLIERLLSEGHQVRGVARNEGKLVSLKEKFPTIEILTGDIADEWTAKKAMQGVDGVFHLAAMKSVDIAEQQVFSCINTNVVGTINLLRESFYLKPKFFIAISTDKASQVSGAYGATKMLMEKLVKETETMNPSTEYRVVRYGNVWESTGSFITKWKPKMAKGEEIFLTDPEMTRFFWTRNEAIDLIFECLDKAKDATPWIPEMKGVSMGTVLEACMEVYGKTKVKIIGNRGGENIHESMDGKTFSNEVSQFTKEEFIKKFL